MTESATQKPPKRRIKEAIQAALKGKTPAGDAVFLSRAIPSQYEDLPIINVYSTGETSGIFDVSQKRYRRVLEVKIECLVTGKDDDDLDLKMEVLADRVEALLEIDETFGGVANSLELIGADYQAESEAATSVGLLSLRYGVEFFAYAQRLEDQILNDFNLANLNWKVGHHDESPDNVVDAVDEVTLT